MGIKQLIDTNIIKSTFAVTRVTVLDKFTLFTSRLTHEKWLVQRQCACWLFCTGLCAYYTIVYGITVSGTARVISAFINCLLCWAQLLGVVLSSFRPDVMINYPQMDSPGAFS